MIQDMKQCLQTENQSVYQHGLSVWNYTEQLINILKSGNVPDGFKIPNWFIQYNKFLLKALLPINIIEEYTIHHDCGKPYCLSTDENGKRHFPNHTEVSKYTWQSIGGCPTVTRLISMDMMIHTMKACDIENFIKHPEAITLLIVGLAEVHANAQMFGGIESTSFKIKWKQIDKRGKVICEKLFNGEGYVID